MAVIYLSVTISILMGLVSLALAVKDYLGYKDIASNLFINKHLKNCDVRACVINTEEINQQDMRTIAKFYTSNPYFT